MLLCSISSFAIHARKTNTVDRELPLNFMRNTPRCSSSKTSDVCHKILVKNVKCSPSPSTLNEHFSWTLHVLVVSFITSRAATEDRGNELFNFLCRHGIRLVDEKYIPYLLSSLAEPSGLLTHSSDDVVNSDFFFIFASTPATERERANRDQICHIFSTNLFNSDSIST